MINVYLGILLIFRLGQMPDSLLSIMITLMICWTDDLLFVLINLFYLKFFFFLEIFYNQLDFFAPLLSFLCFFFNFFLWNSFWNLMIPVKNLIHHWLYYHVNYNYKLKAYLRVYNPVLFLKNCLLLKIDLKNVLFYYFLLKN